MYLKSEIKCRPITYNLMTGISDLVYIHILPGVAIIVHKCLRHSNVVLQKNELIF